MVAVNEIIRLITLRNFNRHKYASILLDYQNNKLVCFFSERDMECGAVEHPVPVFLEMWVTHVVAVSEENSGNSDCAR